MFVAWCDKCGDSIYSDDEIVRNGCFNYHYECSELDEETCGGDCDGTYDDAM